MALIDVYDGAFIHPMSDVPSSVKAICGYVSGPAAYHIWPQADADTVRSSGREFWAIDVPPQMRALSASDGEASANRMIDALPRYSHPKHCPVFINIEYDTYMTSPDGADAAAAQFQQTMNKAGYIRAAAYVPLLAGYGWGAKYNYTRPSALPIGVTGVQYENDARSHPGWDASVFDASWLGAPTEPPTQPDPPAQLEDLMAGINYVWWFGRLTDPPNTIYAINALNGTYFSPGTSHNIAVFKERLTDAGIPFKSAQVDISGSMTQFGILVDDPS